MIKQPTEPKYKILQICFKMRGSPAGATMGQNNEKLKRLSPKIPSLLSSSEGRKTRHGSGRCSFSEDSYHTFIVK